MNWIKTTDRLPEFYCDVFVCQNYPKRINVCWLSDTNKWFYSNNEKQAIGVTHWQPLLDMPQGD